MSLSVSDLTRTRRFYESMLGARAGRVTDQWVDLWLFGAQVTVYQRPAAVVPSPFREAQHFGATLDWDVWAGLVDRLVSTGCEFRLRPTVDEAKGQAKMMLADPDGYLVEIKAYTDPSLLQRPTS
ncbi:MAG TPA: VOC family protein [Brevundimonas sp.]|nr:VOC family protein [Brevundimonas sp. UBA2416]HRJ63455.1 VOC family protein [Brevundimonas sp.]